MSRRLAPGTAGWLAVGLAVVAAEYLDEKTMSSAFREASRHPVAGPCIAAFYGTLTAHLFGFIPPKYDPFHQLARVTFAKGMDDC